MSYTTVDVVRQYLASDWPLASRFHDQPLVVTGTQWTRFYGRPVDDTTLIVKARRGGELTRTSLQLGDSMTSLGGTPLVPGSVVVASDSSLGTVYVEADDYAVDCGQASLVIKAGGRLSSGMQVVVWYRPYRVYLSGADYQVDAEGGRLRRVEGGDISDGETVYLDYTPLYSAASDELLQAAVDEANATIAREVDPDGDFGADPRLQTAAVFRSLATLALAAASRELSSGSAQYRAAQTWLDLAAAYTARSEQHLARFRPPQDGPSGPSHT